MERINKLICIVLIALATSCADDDPVGPAGSSRSADRDGIVSPPSSGHCLPKIITDRNSDYSIHREKILYWNAANEIDSIAIPTRDEVYIFTGGLSPTSAIKLKQSDRTPISTITMNYTSSGNPFFRVEEVPLPGGIIDIFGVDYKYDADDRLIEIRVHRADGVNPQVQTHSYKPFYTNDRMTKIEVYDTRSGTSVFNFQANISYDGSKNPYTGLYPLEFLDHGVEFQIWMYHNMTEVKNSDQTVTTIGDHNQFNFQYTGQNYPYESIDTDAGSGQQHFTSWTYKCVP